jgi:hypothetical protein
MRGDSCHDPLSNYADFGYGCDLMVWEMKLFESEDHADIAERHCRRFYPEMMSSVENSRRRAKERNELKIAVPTISFPPRDLSLAHLSV